MPNSSAAEAADRVAIREVLERYLFALDRRDFSGLASCFGSDAQAEYVLSASGPPERLSGVDEIVSFLRRIEAFPASTHTWGNAGIQIDGDGAESDLLVTATLVNGPAASARVSVRGIRYVDRLVRSGDGWLIAHRRHAPIWQYDVASQNPFLPDDGGS
jgi:hypothetical protein